MEWISVLKCVTFTLELYCDHSGGGGGRDCERQRSMARMLIFREGFEPGTS